MRLRVALAGIACLASACLPSIEIRDGTDGASGGTGGAAGSAPNPQRVLPVNSPGAYFGCVRRPLGIACWGGNAYGQAGTPELATGNSGIGPVLVQGLPEMASISMTTNASCGVSKIGDVYCWGRNSYGALGVPPESIGFCQGTEHCTAAPQKPKLPRSATSIVMGGWWSNGFEHACALLDDQSVMCWGNNASGQLGVSTPGNACSCSTPVPVPGVSGVVELAAGHESTCARLQNKEIWCWGKNFGHALADPVETTIFPPKKIDGIDDAIAIGAGGFSYCAVRSDHSLWCWGQGLGGELGNGDYADQSSPVQVTGLSGVEEVKPGYAWACARTDKKEVWCWGSNTAGQLGTNFAYKDVKQTGIGTLYCNPTPQKVALSDVVEIAAGDSTAYAVTSDGKVWAWGQNKDDKSIGGAIDPSSPQQTFGTPLEVPNLP